MNYTDKVTNIIDKLDLPKDMAGNKEIIKARFVEEVSYYEKKRDHTKKYYNVFRFIVTTGSILLPALLSIGQMDPNKLPRNFSQISYWSTWSISLMVTISNGFLQLFSLDKNFFNYSLVVEQLKTEGWQFFGLSGKYEDHDVHDKESYKEFCKAVENIKRKQVEQEFQGKGNNTKKKKNKDGTDNKSPLMDFDFDGQMKSFMEKSQNNQMFKPLVQTANQVSNMDNMVDNLKQQVVDNVKNEVKDKVDEVKDKVGEVKGQVNDTIIDVNNINVTVPARDIPNQILEQ
jgi:hypothetical protein